MFLVNLSVFELAYLFDRISLYYVKGVDLNLPILIISPGSINFNNCFCFLNSTDCSVHNPDLSLSCEKCLLYGHKSLSLEETNCKILKAVFSLIRIRFSTR